jgi:putative phosphonate catabolism associated alcohol dehydrogenase
MPQLQPGDTLVRIRLATVCGSDLHTVSGRRSGPRPAVLGHEAVGEVLVAGADSDVGVGDRVIWAVTVSCGACVRCRAGRSAKCCSVRKVGHETLDGDWPLSGSYAEHIVLPSGATFAVVPDGMPDAVAAPAACATATVMATLEATGHLAGKRVLICGAGMLGVTAAAACADMGAQVQVVDIDERRRQLARRFGGGDDTGEPVDVALDFTGAAPAVSAALARLDVGGTLVLAGSVLPGPPIAVDPESVVRRWLTITGVHNYEPHHLIRAVEFLDATRTAYPWADLVSTPVALDDIETVMAPTPPGTLRTAIQM